MPVFEYKCNNCGKVFDILHRNSDDQKDVKCPDCSSADIKKLLSTFSAKVSNMEKVYNDCSNGSCSNYDNGGCASGMCGLN